MDFQSVLRQPNGIKFRTANRDGFTDLGTSNGNTDGVTGLLGNGDGTCATAQSFPGEGYAYARSVTTGDFNGDLVSREFQAEADVNTDGTVDLLDIAPFVEVLTGG